MYSTHIIKFYTTFSDSFYNIEQINLSFAVPSI
jgi:hypothetical protein